MPCFCGNQLSFHQCCAPFLSGQQTAETPEQLMRSRYSAYCQKHVDYIYQTYHPSQQPHHPQSEISAFAKSCRFISLQVIQSSGMRQLPKTNEGTDLNQFAGFVEFEVSYLEGNKLQRFREVSRFLPVWIADIRHPGWQWRYLDGVLTPLPSQTIGRNDLCPCGSSKKFKLCAPMHLLKVQSDAT